MKAMIGFIYALPLAIGISRINNIVLYCFWLIVLFIVSVFIIKIAKGEIRMKKKIKDLTWEDCKKICDKYETSKECQNDCPLTKLCGQFPTFTGFDKAQFNKEIEVE